MSNSPLRGLCRAAHLVPAAHFLRPGCRVVVLCLHRISAASAGASAGSCPNPWRQLQLRPRNEGPAERREALLSVVALVRRDTHACEACPSRATGTSASRRSTVALSAQAPLRLRHFRRIGREGCSRPASFMAGLRTPGFSYPRLRAAVDATPRSAFSGSSPEKRPLRARMTNPILYIRYVVNRYIHIVVDRRRPAMWAERPRANGQLPDRPPRLQRWHARTVCFARTNPSRIRSAPISFCSASPHVPLPAMIWSCRTARRHRRSPASSERPHRGDGSRSGDWRRRANI